MHQNNRIISWIISFLFSICMVISISYDQRDNWSLIICDKKHMISALIMTMILTMIVHMIMNVLYSKAGKSFIRLKTQVNSGIGEKIFDHHPIAVPWSILIVLWLPNYILYFPGCLTYDIIRQYEQFFSGNLTNHHPILTTLFEGMFVKFGRNIGCQNVGIAVYLLFTLLFTSGVFAICFYWMHKKNTKYWIRFTGLAFYGLFPIWSAYARTAVKDTLFYPIFVLFVLFIFDIVLEPEKIFDSKVKSILFLIVSLLLCLVRHNGFYILIFTMPFCIVGVKKYRRQLIVLFIIMVAFWELYQKAILPMAGVKPGGKQEMLSIPFQQTARYVKYYGNDVSTEEEKVIRKVLDYDTIGKNYDPDLSDPVKNTYKQKDEYLKDYFNIWFEMLKKHPTAYIQATLNGTYGYWGYMTEIRYPYGYYVQPESMDIYQKEYEIYYLEKTKYIRDIYHGVLDTIYQKTPLTLFTKPMIYLWILIGLLGMVCSFKKTIRYWIAFLPVVTSFLICLASPVNGDMRYMLPITASTILYVAFVNEIIYKEFNKGECVMEKIAVLIPCYNEEKTIKKVVEDWKKELPEATIYVYNNNSTDRTVEIAKEAGAIVRNEYQQGKGNVIRRMFREIDAQCYIMIDGDDTYPAQFGREMAEKVLEYKVDMVVGDRLSSTYFEENKRPFHNLGNSMVRAAINHLFKSNIRDIMTGYRAFSYQFVKTFPVLSRGFEIETEMSIHAVDKNMLVDNVIIEYRDRPDGSESKLNTYTDGMKVLFTIIKLFKGYRPFQFFGSMAFLLMIIAAGLFIPVFMTYLHTGLVPNFPTLIVSGFIALAALQAFFSGLILSTIVQKNRQDFEFKLQLITNKIDNEKDN